VNKKSGCFHRAKAAASGSDRVLFFTLFIITQAAFSINGYLPGNAPFFGDPREIIVAETGGV